NWAEVVGGACGHEPTGIVVTVDTGPGCEGNLERLSLNVELQNSLGIDSRLISPAELKDLQPFARVDDIAAAAYEPTSGYVDAIAATRSMAKAAIREGAAIQEGCRVLALETAGSRVTGLATNDGRLAVGSVVCAAGPWSTELLGTIGVDVPI